MQFHIVHVKYKVKENVLVKNFHQFLPYTETRLFSLILFILFHLKRVSREDNCIPLYRFVLLNMVVKLDLAEVTSLSKYSYYKWLDSANMAKFLRNSKIEMTCDWIFQGVNTIFSQCTTEYQTLEMSWATLSFSVHFIFGKIEDFLDVSTLEWCCKLLHFCKVKIFCNYRDGPVIFFLPTLLLLCVKYFCVSAIGLTYTCAMEKVRFTVKVAEYGLGKN